ncbi:MAG: hypothetical protein ACR2OU_08250 [Thermomicrobiales bacterium]
MNENNLRHRLVVEDTSAPIPGAVKGAFWQGIFGDKFLDNFEMTMESAPEGG